MHRHGDGAFDGGKVHVYAAVIICRVLRSHLFVGLRPSVVFKITLCFLVSHPDGAPAGCLRGHDVYGVPVFYRKSCYARTHKFHYLIFYIAVLIDCSDYGQGHVMRSYAGPWASGKVDGYGLRISEVISAV